MTKEDVLSFLQLEEQPLKNQYGKLTKKTATSLDDKIASIFEGIDVNSDDTKRLTFELAESLSSKSKVAEMEYVHSRLEALTLTLAVEIQKKTYSVELSVNRLRHTVSGIVLLLQRDDTVIEPKNRKHIIAGYEFLKSIQNQISDVPQKAASRNLAVDITINDFKVLQELLTLSYAGGIHAAKKVDAYRDMLADVATEIQIDSKIIQLVELSKEDISSAMKRTVAVVTANELLEKGDDLYAAGQYDDAATNYQVALETLSAFDDLDISAVTAKLADVGKQLQLVEAK